MRLRPISALLLLLACAVPVWATDYDLVVSDGASTVREAQTIQIFDYSGTMKKGDHIISVLYDTLPGDATQCAISVGSSGTVKATLAPPGEATGFDGALQLAAGAPSR